LVKKVKTKLEAHESQKIPINQVPYNNYYIFLMTVMKSLKSGEWVFTEFKKNVKKNNLIEKIKNSKDIHYSSNLLKINTIKSFTRFYDSLLKLYCKTQSKSIDNFTDYIEQKVFEYNLEKVIGFYEKALISYVETSINDQKKILEAKNVPTTISKDLLRPIKINKEDNIFELHLKLNDSVNRINKLIKTKSIKEWIKNYLINSHFVNPWAAYINSGHYLSENITISRLNGSEKLAFWNDLMDIRNGTLPISSSSIAKSFLDEIYELKSNSDEIFKYSFVSDAVD
ncbi:unnamed protein product, partial [marine sediment metagenome]